MSWPKPERIYFTPEGVKFSLLLVFCLFLAFQWLRAELEIRRMHELAQSLGSNFYACMFEVTPKVQNLQGYIGMFEAP